MDSDHPLALGEVGKVGVAIDSLRDMETLFQDIPLERVSVSMTINATAAILLAMVAAIARQRGLAGTELHGTVQNDILKEYIARGTYIYPPRFSMRLITDLMKYCSLELPSWNTISISGYHIREAGSTAVQELAFTFANAIAYSQAALENGMTFDTFAPRLSFFFNIHNDFLEEISKFRAARRVWAKIARERFNAHNPRSMMLRFHAQTAGSTLTAQQPDNNIVRVALQALAGVLGGAQSLHTNSKDEALTLPEETAARLALRTQQIIAWESGVTNTVDPVGGAWAIEAKTDEIERQTWEYLDAIERRGGMLSAIETGWVQSQIQDSAFAYQRLIESGEQIVVGVNRFQSVEDHSIPTHVNDPEFEKAQVAQLTVIRSQRNSQSVAESLGALESAARTNDNLLPSIIAAVGLYATVGEISNVFRRVHGEYREVRLS
jgi:methylmalonyl-CoA mutase N-terminal domain/subunit